MKCLELKGDQTLICMRHLRNQGHSLVTSITVLGETINQSYKKGKDYTKIVDVLRNLDFDMAYPTELSIRETVRIWDFHRDSGTYGASPVDIAHFSYAIISECDYFVTAEGETRGLRSPTGTRKTTRSITLERLMSISRG